MQDLVKTPKTSANGSEPALRPSAQAQSRRSTRIVVAPDDDYNRNLVANVHPPEWENPTPTGKYNFLVIGGGSAGLLAAAAAAGMGAKVALVERHLLGGDCLNVGCVPSKSVIRSSKALGEVMRAADFGVHIPDGVEIDFAAIMQRMRRIRSEISEHDSAQRFKDLGIDLYLGDGHFTGLDTFEVDGRTLNFRRAMISTGSRPAVIPIPGLADVGYLTNETVFELTELPRRLAVIGSGPIGSELSQSFNRFGSQVTLFDVQPRVLGREDDDAAEVLRQVFESEGINLALGAEISGIEAREEAREEAGDGGKIINFEMNGEQQSVTVDEILLAVGRAPNIETLDLEAAGIEYHRRGVTVNDALQTTNPNVYAAGDVAIKYQFTHTADATARIVLAERALPRPQQKGERPDHPLDDLYRSRGGACGHVPAGRRRAGLPGRDLRPVHRRHRPGHGRRRAQWVRQGACEEGQRRDSGRDHRRRPRRRDDQRTDPGHHSRHRPQNPGDRHPPLPDPGRGHQKGRRRL